MNIEEMLSQILENQKQMQDNMTQMQENQKATNARLDTMDKRFDEIKQDIEELKEESKITRAAANHNGEVLEKLIDYLNVPVKYGDFDEEDE